MALATAALLGGLNSAQAQISVTASGNSGTLTFDTLPAAAEFATGVLGTGGATFLDPAAMDAGAQTIDASTVTGALTTSATEPPGTFAAGMRYNTAGLYLQSRPTTGGINGAGVMKATVVNNSGGDLTQVNISYDYAIFNVVAEEVPGFRVFYSFTGAPGSWVLLPALSGNETAGLHSDNLGEVVWPAGGTMYILWADDNDDGLSDYGQTIDNMVISGISAVIAPITITNQPQNLTVNERGIATFSAGASGSPQHFFWFSNNVQVPGNNQSSFTIPSAAFPANNNAQFYVVISNASSFVTSATATLTVNQDLASPTVVSAFSGPAPNTVTLEFNEAMDPALIDAANFVVYPTGSDPDASTIIVTLATLNNGTNVTLTTDIALAGGSNHSVRMLDLRDASSGNNVVDPNPMDVELAVHLYLITFDIADPGNIWKYSTETNLFGTGWETVAYDDSGPTWVSGPAPLGLDVTAGTGGQPPINTPIPYTANSEPQFFRRHFNLPTLTNGLSLSLRHVFEDGGVVFINGQEAGRFNVAAGVALVDGVRAAVNQTDPTPVSGPVPIPLTNVIPGDNVIAVVAIQNGNTSSDIEMAIELMASFPSYPSGPPVIATQPAPSTIVPEGQGFALSVAASGAIPITYQWRKGVVDLSGQTNSTHGVAAAAPNDTGSYTVVVSNPLGSVTSSVASVTVTADLTGPAFLSAVASTNLTNITLVFGERLNQSNAETPGNYDVHLTAGGGNLTIESATLVNNTTVLLVTSPRTQSQSYTIALSGIIDTAINENPATPGSRPVICEIVVLAPDESTLWRYDSSSNNLDATGWQLTGYNDSAWPTALAGFTSSNNLEITTNGWELRSTNMLSPVSGGPITAYYRVPFNLPATSLSGVTLHLVGVVDDGLVAYINGVEAGRLRMTNASPVSFTNLATAAGPETADVHLPLESITLTNLAGLVTGNNLLAIELHQNSLTSSDSVLAVQVVAGIQEFGTPTVGPKLHVSRNEITGAVTIRWSGSGTLQFTTSLQNTGTSWTDVAGNPNPYTFTPAPGEPARFFSLR